MTHYSLTPEERTQLSALLDNELSETERESTIRLLAGSEEARRYLQHLRSLRTLTADNSGGTKRIVAAASPALTGAAIRTAATSYSGGLLGGAGSLLNGWVLAATAGVALLGGVLLTQPGSLVPSAEKPAVVATAPAPAVPIAQAVAVDTASLIVPPLTRTDLFNFAVDGTIPIEAPHRCYLTITPTHGDSMKLTVRSKPPQTLSDLDIKASAIDASLAVLDSLATVVRSVVVKTPNGIALRSDVPQIRALAVRKLESAPQQLPSHARIRVEGARRALVAFEGELPEQLIGPSAFSVAAPDPASFSVSNDYFIIDHGVKNLFIASSSDEEDSEDEAISIFVDCTESRVSIHTSTIRRDNQPALVAVSATPSVPALPLVRSSVIPVRALRRTDLLHTAAQGDTVHQSLRPRSPKVTQDDGDTSGAQDRQQNFDPTVYGLDPNGQSPAKSRLIFNGIEINDEKAWEQFRREFDRAQRYIDSTLRSAEKRWQFFAPRVPLPPQPPVDHTAPDTDNGDDGTDIDN